MLIRLPNIISEKDVELDDNKNLVILGANGSGKTRLSVWIEQNSSRYVHRIAAQKSLMMPQEVNTKSREIASEEYWYGMSDPDKEWLKDTGKRGSRWRSNPNTSLLNDFEPLLVLLHTEEYEEAVKFKDGYKDGVEKPYTKLDRIQEVWEKVITHRKIEKGAGVVYIYPKDSLDKKYNAKEMSDGERLVFYIIGAAVCAPEGSIIIIDEPENHLHYSIIDTLWNEIERNRPDCKFIYLTHNVDFAISRSNRETIWIKSYEGNEKWAYELLNDEDDIPKEIYYELLGSRRNILFIEGDKESLDYKIYSQLFRDYTVKPLASCSKVIQATQAFNQLSNLHHLKAIGIIDRDRRLEQEIIGYRQKNIFTPELAEIENFFMAEEVIKCIAKVCRVEDEQVFEEVREKVFQIFKEQLEKQCTEFSIYKTKEKIRDILQEFENEKTYNNFFNKSVDAIKEFNYEHIYKESKKNLSRCLEENNYNEILKYFNYKGLMGASKVFSKCEFSDKKKYIDFTMKILREESEVGEELRNAFCKYIIIG